VALFVFCDFEKRAANDRVLGVLGGFCGFDGGERFAEARFRDRHFHDRFEGVGVETAFGRERTRADGATGVRGREPEAHLGVTDLVSERALRKDDELARRPEREKLEDETSERRDGGVLHESDAAVVFGEHFARRLFEP
jgi:hypothetical protein